MKSLISLLIIVGIAAYYAKQLRDENAELKQQIAVLTENMTPEQKAELFTAAPLKVTDIVKPTSGAPKTVHKHVICPGCKGEGSVMVRRNIGSNGSLGGVGKSVTGYAGSITDVKVMCGLCMSSGKREFDMPARAEVCSDCGGMGKRLILRSSTLGGGESKDGYAQQAPTTTSCPRCLGRGYFERPGLK